MREFLSACVQFQLRFLVYFLFRRIKSWLCALEEPIIFFLNILRFRISILRLRGILKLVDILILSGVYLELVSKHIFNSIWYCSTGSFCAIHSSHFISPSSFSIFFQLVLLLKKFRSFKDGASSDCLSHLFSFIRDLYIGRDNRYTMI